MRPTQTSVDRSDVYIMTQGHGNAISQTGYCVPRPMFVEKMLQAAVKTLPLLVLEIDKDGLILDTRGDCPTLFCFNSESLVGRHLRTIFPEEVASEIDEILSEISHGSQPQSLVYAVHEETQTFWLEARFVVSLNQHCSVVLEDITRHKQNEIKVQQQLGQLSALRAIDQAIASSVDLRLTLNILLQQLVNHLHIDAASILLWNSDTERLEYVTGLGFKTRALSYTKLRMGDGYAGIAALEQRVVHKGNLSHQNTDFLRSPSFTQEGFISYFGIPLVAKGKTQGVLEVFNRSYIRPDTEWLKFLEMLGGQAAIAIDNAILFNNLQRTNFELTSAYNATIEGWSRALDMRDHETEGHTQRVTEMAVNLAKKMGFSSHDLIHIRRGAALHDIGKMGIPDYVLHKPGPLTEAEWDTMRQHPQNAFNLLSPIDYLRSAMEIPCFHHERWDGSGYPSGLKGEEIPVSARLFALVDVFDALTSDRPYRPAWSREDAVRYIEEQKGILFDPKITPMFLELIKGKNGSH